MAKKELEEIYVKITMNAFDRIFSKVIPIGFDIDNVRAMENDIRTNAQTLIDDVLKDVALKVFKQFIMSPQIYDLLADCLEAMLMSEFIEEKLRKLTIVDNSINYCLEVIENHYPPLSDDNSTVAIKKYLETLLIPRRFLLETMKKQNIIINAESAQKQFVFFVYKGLEDEIDVKTAMHDDCINRVEKELDAAYICDNKQLEAVKVQYHTVLKKIYQMGFIHFVGEFKFNNFYISPVVIKGLKISESFLKEVRKDETREQCKHRRERWRYIFNESDIIYVVGGPGYGKSLFLRNIINNYSKLLVPNIQDYMLIYCDLKSFYVNGDPSKKTVVDFLQESMISITGVSDITQEVINYYLKRGRCIVLLDALDEVPKDVRDELHKKMYGYFSTVNPNNKICITSRDKGFIPQEEVEICHICPLSSYDIEEYLDKMIALKKFKKEEKEAFLEQAEVLIEKDFLNNFLVLSLLVNIYKAEKQLPENKIDLYKKCFDYIAKQREEEKSKIGYNWKNISPLMKDSTFISLAVLAAPNNSDIKRESIEELLKAQYKTKYPDEVSAECAIKEFLEFCATRTELFVPSSVDDKFKFFHRSFFEYFYSRYIYQQATVKEIYDLMTGFDVDTEVFELTVALIKEDNEPKYQELLEYMYAQIEADFKSGNPNFIAFEMFTLSMQVIDDIYYINKYFDIVLSYSKLMENEKVNIMNQQLMFKWSLKGIGDSEEKKERFRSIYEKKSLIYTLQVFARLKAEGVQSVKYTLEEGKDIELEKAIVMEHEIMFQKALRRHNKKNVPFYVLVYEKYFGMKNLLDSFDKRTIDIWLNSQNVHIRRQKSFLKKGLTMYQSFAEKEQNLFMSLLSQ